MGTSRSELSWLQGQCAEQGIGRGEKDLESEREKREAARCVSAEKKGIRVGEVWWGQVTLPEVEERKEKEECEEGAWPSAGAYREGRKPRRETKSRKKGGSVRQIPRGVSSKRGTYRVSKWVRDGVLKGKKSTGEGSKKALIVERGLTQKGNEEGVMEGKNK